MSRTQIELGPGVSLDVQRLVDTRMLVQANSGGGKSWALRRLLEQTAGSVQHLVIDPEGEFSTLRERFDYVLASRSGGDTTADPRAARLLAERLLELKVSAILDIYELKAHDRVRFVRYFLEALVDAPKKLWHPALVVLDEAHVYCPQAGEAESAGAVIDLATRGRKRGFCAVLATQRLSKLHKDAAAECNNKLIGRTGLDVDVKRASEELGFGRERHVELRQLDAGQFFTFGPAISREVVPVRIGGVKTTHPRAGARLEHAPPPSAAVKALLPKLADLPAEAEERQRTTESLRAEVQALKRQLAQQPKAAAPPAQKTREVEVIKPATVARLEKLVERSFAIGVEINRATSALVDALPPRGALLKEVMPNRILAPSAAREIRSVTARPARVASVRANSIVAAESLSGPEQRILDALAWLEQITPEPEQTAVAFMARYRVGGGAFNNPRGSLRGKGLIEYRSGDRMALTEAGRAHANTPEIALTADELQRRVMDNLPGPEQRLLRPLLMCYPKALTNEALAREANYEPGGGAFNNPRGRLRSLGLVEYPESGTVKARSVLFLE